MKRLLLLVALALGELVGYAQISSPINAPVFRAFDPNGQPLSGGKLFSYAAGSSTPLATYADAARVTPNTNPVILDSTGQAKIFMGLANYKFILQDANGVQQWSIDSVNGAPPLSAVTSVFGRTGTILAVSGDYTCGQVTGAICSLPTIYYQTIQANGSSQTQQPKLNLLNGTNVTVSCVNNSGASSTDCTIASSATATIPGTVADVTGSRSIGSTYQNTSGSLMIVSGFGSTTGSAWAAVTCTIGPSSPTLAVYAAQYGATTDTEPAGFFCAVPNNYFYSVTTTGTATFSLTKWIETLAN